MNIVPVLSSLTACLFILMSLFIFFIDRQSKVNVFMSLAWLCHGIWALMIFFASSTSSMFLIHIWYRVGMICAVLFYLMMLRVCLVLGNSDLTKINAGLLYGLAGFFLFFVIIKPSALLYSAYWMEDGQMVFKLALDSPLFYLFIAYVYVVVIFSHLGLYRWYRKAPTVVIKRMAIKLMSAKTLSHLLALIDIFILPALTSHHSRNLIPLYYLPGLLMAMYCMLRFRFLAMTAEAVSRDIVANIDQAIIFFDMQGTVITANEKMNELLGVDLRKGMSYADFLPDYMMIWEQVVREIKTSERILINRMMIIDTEKKEKFIDAKFSRIKDRYNETIGVMVSCQELKNVSDFQSEYRLTNREMEIINNIALGFSNKEIAAVMNIAENTLKRHITNFYNKMGINYKVQLMHCLKEYKILPEVHSSERPLLLETPACKL